MSKLIERYYDLSPADDFGFVVTTENISVVREMAKKAHPKSILGIAGGGEQLLLGFLPLNAQCVGVDIARRPLASTFLKALLVERNPSKKVKSIIEKGEDYFYDFQMEVADEFPIQLRPIVNSQRLISGSNYERFRNVWLNTEDSIIGDCRQNLENLSLVHSGMSEIRNQKIRFDLVYCSNAVRSWEPLSVEGNLGVDDLVLLTKNNGYIFTSYPFDKVPGNFNIIDRQIPLKGGWEYSLYQVEPSVISRLKTGFTANLKDRIERSPLTYFIPSG